MDKAGAMNPNNETQILRWEHLAVFKSMCLNLCCHTKCADQHFWALHLQNIAKLLDHFKNLFWNQEELWQNNKSLGGFAQQQQQRPNVTLFIQDTTHLISSLLPRAEGN